MRIDPKYFDYAKGGLFMALGSAVDKDGNKVRIEVTDEQLTNAVRNALDDLASELFGQLVTIEKDVE